MTEKEVKIYAYKLSIVEGNIQVEEIVFPAIEKQKTFVFKQDGDNPTKRVVYNLNAPIEDSIVSERRNYFMRGRRTLKKDELEEITVSPFGDMRYIYYTEPSLEEAMSAFKRSLEARIKGFKSKIESLTTKIKVCEGFVADVENIK
jgi:hypothetical protein